MISRDDICNQYYKAMEELTFAENEAAFLLNLLDSQKHLQTNPQSYLQDHYNDLVTFNEKLKKKLAHIRYAFGTMEIDQLNENDYSFLRNITKCCSELRMEFNKTLTTFTGIIDKHFAIIMKNESVDFLSMVNFGICGAKKYLVMPLKNNDKQTILEFVQYFEDVLQPLQMRLVPEDKIKIMLPPGYVGPVADEHNECIRLAGLSYFYMLDELLQHITNKLKFRFNTVNTLKTKNSEISGITSNYIRQGMFNPASTPLPNEKHDKLIKAIRFIKNNLDFFSAPFLYPKSIQDSELLSPISNELDKSLNTGNQLQEFKFILIGGETDITCFNPNALRIFLIRPVNENLLNFLAENMQANQEIIDKYREEKKVKVASEHKCRGV